MSDSSRRVCSLHAANVLISAALLVSTGACYHAPSPEAEPVAGESSLRRQQATEEFRPRLFPGIQFAPVGHSAFVVQIHSGMVGSGNPLYVIDGAPMTIQPNRGIDWFKPEDIAAIKVLKTPDELAVYGPSGVNGVILITTKQAAARRR
jgi:TonB-dependent SusC/RagA subfamily outer membrane receptor